MARYTLHKAATRGYADHGWLKSYQSFSFAGYYNPERIQFGVLRVLNDDVVAGGKGFGEHPHDNMEIISIPLEGALEHKDNLGNAKVIHQGDVQVMSTGQGVFHSEYNHYVHKETRFLQIWVFPNKLNVAPRYDQITLNPTEGRNQLLQFISPNPQDSGTWIHQDAWFHLGYFDRAVQSHYALHKQGNGVYVFVIKGNFIINGQELESRDGLGIEQATEIGIVSLEDNSELLVMEVPMKL